MTIEKKFEVIRNEEEHQQNLLHRDLKMWFNYYVKVGCSPTHAIKYAYWNLKNRGYMERKEDENK